MKLENEHSQKNEILIKGARTHNLKNINLNIPKNKLIVFTGLSGSGKSSLAFDTIYAEGQRRYVESLNTYARQFLGLADKPDVDSIEGLAPAISIDQKTKSHNPRSTVGTVTEIYDYLRLLFARIGKPYCPNGHGLIQQQTTSEIISKILNFPQGDKVIILSPVITKQKGSHQNILEKLKNDGFYRIRVDNNEYTLSDKISLNKNKFHNISIVVDRWVVDDSEDSLTRLNEAIEVAFEYSNGYLMVHNLDKGEEILFSQQHSCKVCGFSLPELEPRLFSFNSHIGACERCEGIGSLLSADEELIVPNPELSLNDGAIKYSKLNKETDSYEWSILRSICKTLNIDMDTPFKSLSKDHKKIILYGSEEAIEINFSFRNRKISKYENWEGFAKQIERRYYETQSNMSREYYTEFMTEKTCPQCLGKRLNKMALCVKIADHNIADICSLPINECIDFFEKLKLSETDAKISNLILKEILARLGFLNSIGLSYLELNRNSDSLSGGESQRIRLATQIGSALTGVLYVLDEPSIGLHQKDNLKLIQTLKNMRDIGNTLIVVEHDQEMMEEADYIVDIGPKAGEHGGKIIFQGLPKDILKCPNSLTGEYLSGERKIKIRKNRRGGNGLKVEVIGASENNLKKINASFPLGKFIVVTGVSGGGKSTLINNVLYRALQKKLGHKVDRPGKHIDIKGSYHIDKIINVSQDPIGRTPRSNPATYTSIFDDIRDIFASLPESKALGYTKSRFSFNVPGGRCEKCHGDGTIKISMHFLPDIYVECSECKGKRFNQATLKIKYHGKNIYDVLEMTIDQAYEFFNNFPKLVAKLKVIKDVGLGYIHLGQPATQLSGGEAQRVKLATYLMKRPTGKTIFILDEPTTGLHFYDIENLVKVINKIVDNGDTVISIEHNLDIIKCADHIIDMGPDGGKNGGEIVATGTPEQVANNSKSYTAPYIKDILSKSEYE